MRDTHDSDIWNDFVDSCENSQSEIRQPSAPIQSKPKSKFITLINRDGSIKRCEMCGKPMPADRVKPKEFSNGRQFKYCSTECANDYKLARRHALIIKANEELTQKLNRLHGDAKDEFLSGLLFDHIKFRIGAVEDRTERNLMRRQSEAVSNAFLFGSNRAGKTIYNVFIAWTRSNAPEIADSIYNASALLAFAKENGLVPFGFAAPAPVLISFSPVTTPEPANRPERPVERPQRPLQLIQAVPPAEAPQEAPEQTTDDEQAAFSALIAYAQEKNKLSSWIDWMFKRRFGHLPEGLKTVAGPISTKDKDFIVNASKDYSEKVKTSDPANQTEDPKEKAIIESVSALVSDGFTHVLFHRVSEHAGSLFADNDDYYSTLRRLVDRGIIESYNAKPGDSSEMFRIPKRKAAA